jgi:hypothetical protein
MGESSFVIQDPDLEYDLKPRRLRGPRALPRDRRPDDRSLTSVSVQAERLLQYEKAKERELLSRYTTYYSP